MILGGWLAFALDGVWKPIRPTVVLPAEQAWPGWYLVPPGWLAFLPDGLPLTNTMLSLFLASLALFAVAFLVVRPFVRRGQDVPSGFYQLIEAVVEYFWNSTESAAGRWARRIFPLTMTIFLYVLVANLFKLLPLHETVGYAKLAHATGYHTVVWNGIHLLDASKPGQPEGAAAEEIETDGHEAEGSQGFWAGSEPCPNCEVVPILRGAATDLNFTVSLALITMVAAQLFGVRALGLGYFTKFFNVKTLIDKPFFGLMDFLVGILELISELAKVLSFSLRLFGVIFAGTLLLGILGSMTVVFVPGLLVGLELFVGIIQAYVFSALAQTFLSQAVVSHHGEAHASAH